MSFDPVLLKFWVVSVSIVSCFLLLEPFIVVREPAAVKVVTDVHV